MIPSLVTAVTNYVETEYRAHRNDDVTPTSDFPYALAAITHVGLSNSDRYNTMLAKYVQSMEEVDRTTLLATYELGSGVYMLLTQELEWPLTAPENVPVGLTEEEVFIRKQAEAVRAINRDRDARIEGGFTWNGHDYQSRQSDRENIMGASIAAQLAIGQGAEADDLRWADPANDFVWITANNELIPMDVFAVLALYSAGMKFKTDLTFYARALKDQVLAAEDLTALQAINISTGWPHEGV